jgi:hypothetical protein
VGLLPLLMSPATLGPAAHAAATACAEQLLPQVGCIPVVEDMHAVGADAGCLAHP